MNRCCGNMVVTSKSFWDEPSFFDTTPNSLVAGFGSEMGIFDPPFY